MTHQSRRPNNSFQTKIGTIQKTSLTRPCSLRSWLSPHPTKCLTNMTSFWKNFKFHLDQKSHLRVLLRYRWVPIIQLKPLKYLKFLLNTLWSRSLLTSTPMTRVTTLCKPLHLRPNLTFQVFREGTLGHTTSSLRLSVAGPLAQGRPRDLTIKSVQPQVRRNHATSHSA